MGDDNGKNRGDNGKTGVTTTKWGMIMAKMVVMTVKWEF